MCEETNPAKEAQRQIAIDLLAKTYAEEFVEYMEGDPRMQQALMEVCSDFMDDMLPIVNDESKFDVGLGLINRVYLKADNS